MTDLVSVPLGFRFFSVDAAQGFSLNGQYLDLHGVNRHQDRLNMGWAITNAQHDEDMALIREMGANVVRLSHYQHAELLPRSRRSRRHRAVGRDPAGQRHHRLRPRSPPTPASS